MDIHGGGFDLRFPHHDNELAQSEVNKLAFGFCSEKAACFALTASYTIHQLIFKTLCVYCISITFCPQDFILRLSYFMVCMYVNSVGSLGFFCFCCRHTLKMITGFGIFCTLAT